MRKRKDIVENQPQVSEQKSSEQTRKTVVLRVAGEPTAVLWNPTRESVQQVKEMLKAIWPHERVTIGGYDIG